MRVSSLNVVIFMGHMPRTCETNMSLDFTSYITGVWGESLDCFGQLTLAIYRHSPDCPCKQSHCQDVTEVPFHVSAVLTKGYISLGVCHNTDARSVLAGNSMFIERQNTKQTTLSLEDMCTVQAIKDIKASRLENNPFTDIEKQELMNFLCTQWLFHF